VWELWLSRGVAERSYGQEGGGADCGCTVSADRANLCKRYATNATTKRDAMLVSEECLNEKE